MADDSAFLNSIIATPDDDTPRLVFADWLDEHGDSPRAEFIRTQIENHHRPSPALARRSDELLARHRNQWIIPGISGVQTFRRGFVEGLRIATEDFLANAERIGRAAPVVELRLPIAIDYLAELAAVPWLERIQHLDLTGNVGLGSRLDSLFGVAELPRLRSLILRNCQLWPEELGILARFAERWPKLTSLNLSGNPIGLQGLGQLSEPGTFTNVEELILRCDEQHEENAINWGIMDLVDSPTWKSLRRLDLTGHYLDGSGIVVLCCEHPSRKKNLKLIELDLTDNEIGPDLQRVVGEDLRNEEASLTSLRRLILDGNRFGPLLLNALLNWKQLAVMDFISLRNLIEPLDEECLALIQSSQYGVKILHN